VTIAPHGFLVIFASGKDRIDPQAELHTNFRLSGTGEFLALVEPGGTKIRQQFAPMYPDQATDVSYGLAADGATPQFFDAPTPGAENGAGWAGLASAPAPSVQRGFFDAPFDVELFTNTAGAQIRYTLDGRVPRADTGFEYQSPIRVNGTTTLRAATFKSDHLPSQVQTHTYLFLDNVLTQMQPAGYPDLPAGDYRIIPAVVDNHRDTILDDLKSVPTVSLVMAVDDMFGPQGTNTTGEDKPTSMEMIFADGRRAFQIDSGIRQQGGASRMESVPKHAFRLRFMSEYGPTKLEYPLFADSPVTSFDTVILRAGLQDGWQRGPAEKNQFVKDEFARRTQLAMGNPSAHGTWVHLYINGLYWGLYNLTERPDASFTSAHMGGAKSDWDALNAGRVRDGNSAAWDAMVALTPRGGPDLPKFDAARVEANYQALQQYLDIPGFIDYVLIGTYLGTSDWLPNNYYAARRSRDGDGPVDPLDPAGKFRFFHWDQEASMMEVDRFRGLPGFGSPVGQLFQLLRLHPGFREMNAQRLYDHMFNGGALSPEVAAERYQGLIDEVKDAIKGEAIRWGTAPSNFPGWQIEAEWLLNTYIPSRREGVLGQYRRIGLYPNTDAPVFSQQGGRIAPDEPTAPLTLASDTVIRARTLAADEWSVVNHAEFTVAAAPQAGDFDANGLINAADIDLLCQQIRATSPNASFDLTSDGQVDQKDHEHLVENILRTALGDANLDGIFDSSDLISVLQAQGYEQNVAASWASGDWNCDGVFGTQDLVLAFQQGGFR
jgi:hypothetical protein